jgi:hypothetical protein
MQVQRVTSLLHDVVDVRNWTVQHFPMAKSMAGYDLFLKLGNDCLCQKTLELQSVLQQLPHPEDELRAQVNAMVQAGLLVLDPADVHEGGRMLPTDRFIELLRQFHNKYESVFIPRKGLREKQLLANVPDARLHQLVDTMYDHFFDMGWLFLHNFGGVCFLMASLVRRVARAYGFQARIESCQVVIDGGERTFNLGSPGFAAPGQIEGHAVCVIDEAVLLDFGLGNVRRGFRRDFYWGLACPYVPAGPVMAQMLLPQQEMVTWKNDWQTPDGPAEIAKFESLVEEMFKQYTHQFA